MKRLFLSGMYYMIWEVNDWVIEDTPAVDDQVKVQSNPIVRLPPVKFPEFSENILDWASFWDSFNSMIHSNQGISKVDKFKYLMSSLVGEARETLRDID